MPDAVKSPVAPIRTVFAARARPGDVENLIVDREQPPRVIDDELARRRQAHARRALVEQVGAEQALQPLDLGADRRLRDAERLRRLGETAQIDDGDQCPQQLGRDIGHDTFAPHGCSGRAGTATNWVVQAVIPTCGFRPPIRDFKTSNNPMASYIPFIPCEIRALTCRYSAYLAAKPIWRAGTMASAHRCNCFARETCYRPCGQMTAVFGSRIRRIQPARPSTCTAMNLL